LAYALRAICYKERGWNNIREQKEYFNQAISDFSKAIEIDPNNEKYIYLRGSTYWESTMHLSRRDEFERKISCLKANKDFNQLIKLDGEWKKNGYQLRAFCNETLGNIQEALADYNQLIALEEHPFGISQRHAQRGKFYSGIGEFSKAIADFDKAIELNPDFIYYYRERGEIHAKAKNYNLAIADFTKFIKLKPEDHISYEERGNAYLNIGNYQKAITDFNTAIKIKPDGQYLYLERGNAYQKMGQYQKAISDYDRAIEINPTYAASAYCGRGEVYSKMGNHNQAVIDFDRAIELWWGDGNYAQAYYGRGLAFIKKGNQKQGFDDIKTAARGGFKDAQSFLMAKGIRW
jgi:tetratricopeptide (TPR) repeat protein